MHSNLSQYYIGGEGSTGTPNLYYVINGRPLNEKSLASINRIYMINECKAQWRRADRKAGVYNE